MLKPQDTLNSKPLRNAYSVRIHSLSSELHHSNMKFCHSPSSEGTDLEQLYAHFIIYKASTVSEMQVL